MKWQEARMIFPDRWVIIDAIESHLEGVDVRLDEMAVLATTTEGQEVMPLHPKGMICGQWQRKLPNAEIFFVHTSQEVPPLKDYRHLSRARYYIPREERMRLAALRSQQVNKSTRRVGG